MSVLETVTEKHGVLYSARLGYLSFKLTPQGQRGWPDRLFINSHGFHIYVEFKKEGEQLRRLQEFRCGQLEDRGCLVFRGVSSKHEIEHILKEYREVKNDIQRL